MNASVLRRLELYTVTPWADCQLYQCNQNEKGYGRIKVDGAQMRIHRVVWELTNGPIPDGLTVDHLCRVRNCVNPTHMELVTVEENTRREHAARPLRGRPSPDGKCRRGLHDLPADRPKRLSCPECQRARGAT